MGSDAPLLGLWWPVRRRVTPPVPPEPQCFYCGSYEVVQEALEDGAPLCEEHDHPIARKKIPLVEAIADKDEAKFHLQKKLFGMSREPSEEQKEKMGRISERITKTIEKKQKLEERLEEIQEECDHPDEWMESSKDVAYEEDFDQVPKSEVPDELPAVFIHAKCKLCGLEGQIYQEGVEPEQVEVKL